MSAAARRSRSRATRRRRASLVVTATLSSVLGCNTILDNQPPLDLVTEEAGTLPSTDAGSDRAKSTADASVDAGPKDPGPLCPPCALAHATATCQGGSCIVTSCDPGYADCNGIADDGCETDLSKATTCGACNAVCPPVAPLCAPIGGAFQCTNGCPAATPVRCGTTCVDLLTSETHCGSCNVACPAVANATVSCAAGICAFTCNATFHECAGKCASVLDITACGLGCLLCPAAPNAHVTCAAGVCGFACSAGFADCDLLPANGCEAELARDPLNCGACGASCDGGTCTARVCHPPPDAGP